VLLVYEDHSVVGRRLPEFEALYRDHWSPTLSTVGPGRLLWYFDRLLGEAHHVLTIAAFPDGRAYEDFVNEAHGGKLADLVEELTALRYSVRGKLLNPAPWSPPIDLGAVPTTPEERAVSVFLENIAWPDKPLAEFVANLGATYEQLWSGGTDQAPPVQLVGAFQTASPGPRPQMTVLQRLRDPLQFLSGVVTKLPPDHPIELAKAEGLKNRDRFESNLLMTAVWSPCP
jgi:hypothetical protein